MRLVSTLILWVVKNVTVFFLLFLTILTLTFIFAPNARAACSNIQSNTFTCGQVTGDWCVCEGGACMGQTACSAIGDSVDNTSCSECGSEQEARDCACGGGGALPCRSAADPDGNRIAPPVCQVGDPWEPPYHVPPPPGHSAGCQCGGAQPNATPEPGSLCIPWEFGSSCSCNGGTPGAPTLIAPPNGDQNQVPSGIHLSWNPISNWAYGNCPFTQVKRYYVYVKDLTDWWVASLEDGRSISCANENNRSSPTNTTPSTFCDIPINIQPCIPGYPGYPNCKSYTRFPYMGPLTPGHTYQWAVRAENFFGPGPLSTPWTFKVASCSISLSPSSTSIMTGSTTPITANVVPASGVSIKRVDFSSNNTGVVTVSPGQDSNSPYATSARGVAGGNAAISANAILSDNSIGCSTTSSTGSNITVTRPVAWWQVKDADVMAGGSLTSLIPSSCILPGCDPNFDKPGDGGYPGIPSYVGSYDFSADTGSKGLVSTPQGWIANSATSLKRLYDFAFFKRQVPTEVTTNPLFEITSPSVNGGFFNSNGAAAKGYAWYHFDGSTYGDLLTINGNVNLVGNRKVILLVEGANLNITSKVNIQSRGQGFFMAVAGKASDGSKGNITIDPSVSSPNTPALEGIYYADNQFSTGAGTNWLYFHGSIAALGGFNLQRNLTNNSAQPAEFFEYAPELMTLYPNVFKNRKIRWKEVAP